MLLRAIAALPKDDDRKQLKGIGGALEGCLRTAKLIISDRHLLARMLIFSSKNQSVLRISIWDALLRTLMYLNYRIALIRRRCGRQSSVRGNPKLYASQWQLREVVVATVRVAKIRRYTNTLPQAEKDRTLEDLETCLAEACNAYNAKGHCSNHKEGNFAIALLYLYGARSEVLPFGRCSVIMVSSSPTLNNTVFTPT